MEKTQLIDILDGPIGRDMAQWERENTINRHFGQFPEHQIIEDEARKFEVLPHLSA